MFASSSTCPVAPRLLPKKAPSPGGRRAAPLAAWQSEEAERRISSRADTVQRSSGGSSSLGPASSSLGPSSSQRPVYVAPPAYVGHPGFASVGQPQCSTSRYWALPIPNLDLSDRRTFSSTPPRTSSSHLPASNPSNRFPASWCTSAGRPSHTAAPSPLPPSRSSSSTRPSADDRPLSLPLLSLKNSPEGPSASGSESMHPADISADLRLAHSGPEGTPSQLVSAESADETPSGAVDLPESFASRRFDEGGVPASLHVSSPAEDAPSEADADQATRSANPGDPMTLAYPDETYNVFLYRPTLRSTDPSRSTSGVALSPSAGPLSSLDDAAGSTKARASAPANKVVDARASTTLAPPAIAPPPPTASPDLHTKPSHPAPPSTSRFAARPSRPLLSSRAPPPSAFAIPSPVSAAAPPPLSSLAKLVQLEAERLLRQTILPRLREQYEADVAHFAKTLSNDLLRDVHAQAAGRARAALMPNLSPDQDPPEVLLNLVRAVSGPKDMANAMGVLREAKRKGWQLHPDTAVAIADCFPPIEAIRVLRDTQQFGVSIPPLGRLRVLRTVLKNLFSGENPLGLESPPLSHAELGYFRILARNQHLEDPLMVALMLNAYAKLRDAAAEQRTTADSGLSLAALSREWPSCPLSPDEAHVTMVLVDNIRDQSEAAALFDTLPLLHVHRHRERLLALLQRSLSAGDRLKSLFHFNHEELNKSILPWQSSLAIHRISAAAEVKRQDGEVLNQPKLQRWLRPALTCFPDDPIVLMLALQLATRLQPRAAPLMTASLLERLDSVDLAGGGWRLVHDDDERLGPARTLARRTIELGLVQLKDVLGDRVALWEQLLE